MKIKYFNECTLKECAPTDNPTVIKNEDIVDYVVKQKVVKTGEGEFDFITEDVVVEASRVNRKDYIESYANDVGIINIMRKVQLTGDATLLDQVKGQYADITGYPENYAQAQAMVQAGKDAAAAAGISYSEEALKKFIDELVAQKVAAQQKGE